MDLFSRLNQRMAAKLVLPGKHECLPGRDTAILSSQMHDVSGVSIFPPFPDNTDSLIVGLGCFWGAERLFWQQPGVYVTAVGYCGGYTSNPTYEEVCSGNTAHAEVVLIVFYPEQISIQSLLRLFWESHDPTQAMRQGNDVGTQYRSAIYVNSAAQYQQACASKEEYAKLLAENNKGSITTEIVEAGRFYYAEEYHQQYLAKNPNGYCGLSGVGVKFKS